MVVYRKNVHDMKSHKIFKELLSPAHKKKLSILVVYDRGVYGAIIKYTKTRTKRRLVLSTCKRLITQA